jgi:hypothetical protein
MSCSHFYFLFTSTVKYFNTCNTAMGYCLSAYGNLLVIYELPRLGQKTSRSRGGETRFDCQQNPVARNCTQWLGWIGKSAIFVAVESWLYTPSMATSCEHQGKRYWRQSNRVRA